MHFGVAVHRFGQEIAGEFGLGVELENRHVIVAAIVHENRFVVGHEFGEQRDAKQDRKDPKAPIGAAVTGKVTPAALVQRG